MNVKNYSMQQYLLIMVAALLLVSATVAQAGWFFDAETKTFVLDPSLVTGDVFEHTWKADSLADPNGAIAPDVYLYEHDMRFQTDTWYGDTDWFHMKSFDGWTGTEAAADYRILCKPNGLESGGLVGLRSTTWHNANQPDLQMDAYSAYSTDDGANYTEYYREDWVAGNPAGTGYGVSYSYHVKHVVLGSCGTANRLRYGVDGLTEWDEYTGASWRVWGKSHDLTYSDNYETNPLAGAVEGGPFWDIKRAGWLDYNGGSMANNYGGSQTEVVYLIAHDGPIQAIDIRLTSTDLAAGAEATFCAGTETMLHLAIATEADGTYTDVYTTTQWKSQANNPGAYVDLTSYGNPEVLFVKIYSTTGASTSHYIRWSGFQVELTAPAATCAHVWNDGFGNPADFDKDCDVDLVDFAILVADWMKCNDPAACPEAWN